MPDFHQKRRLGIGAFGEVWLAQDRAFGIDRAVKLVPPGNITTPTSFYSEPQTLNQLAHPNVVEVHDAGRLNDGRLYIAMSFYKNGSLEDYYQGAIVPLRKAVAISIDVCKGLEYAHSQGYVHRDIKPANVLLDDDLVARISDFGLCTNKLVGGAASANGYIVHLAPEVILNDQFTFQSDVYAAGLTAYRLVNGDSSIPVTLSSSEFRDMIIDGSFPDRNRFQPFVPRRLRRAIRKAIAFDPSSRFSTARDFRHALEGVRPGYDWSETVMGARTVWVGASDRQRWSVESFQMGPSYHIETFQLSANGAKRRKSDLCSSFPRVADHRRELIRVFDSIND